MPKQKRWTIKRELDRAVNCIDNAQNHLVVSGREFEQPHPEIFQKFCKVVAFLDDVKVPINLLRDEI